MRTAVAALAGLLSSVLPLRAADAPRADQLVVVAPQAADSKEPLLGYLARPDESGRLPAVVLLHGCDGFYWNMPAWAGKLRSWGYVGLAVDSLTPRHIRNGCTEHAGAVEETVDGFAALRYLAGQRFVDPARIGVLGFSRGGSAALVDVEQAGVGQLLPVKFRVGVAYYPYCADITGGFMVPVLILAGEKDDWLPAAECRAMAGRIAGKGVPVSLVVYPGATHAFNFDAPPRHRYGHFMTYDPQASQDAERRVRQFLDAALGLPASEQNHSPNGIPQ